jgi:hypothetical protein
MSEANELISEATCCIRGMTKRCAAGEQPSARDWAAFFAALGQLLTIVLPVILPLFMKDQTE